MLRYPAGMASARNVRSARTAMPSDPLAPVVGVWSQLKDCLERQCTALSEEVRDYPTPIARCDEQLTRLIERRSRAFDALNRLVDATPPRTGRSTIRWRSRLHAYLAMPEGAIDDARERELRTRLREMLAEPRRAARQATRRASPSIGSRAGAVRRRSAS